MKEIFITATDTDAGKTFVSCAIISALKQELHNPPSNIYKVAAFKPVAAGCELVDNKPINEDAKLLSEFSNAKQSISEVNPIAFKEPIAPHIAAIKHKRNITVAEISMHYQQVKSLNADFTLVEGAGGWRLPLGVEPNSASNAVDKNKSFEFLSDFVKTEKLKAVLIVNMKLGCLNHALLTYETIKADGIECVAWIANCASGEVMDNLNENIASLEQLLPIPKMAQLNFIEDIDAQGNHVSFENKVSIAASQIDIAPLLN